MAVKIQLKRLCGSPYNDKHCKNLYYSREGEVVNNKKLDNYCLYCLSGLCDIRGCKAPINEDEYNLVTKVVYPSDVVRGAINLIVWDLKNRDKTGISSETIGRHSVSYFNTDGDNSVMGYPKSLLGFLKPNIKARF